MAWYWVVAIVGALLLLLIILIGLSESTQDASVYDISGSRRPSRKIDTGSSKYTNIYRTKDGKAHYVFRYVNIGSEYSPRYEIDILAQPEYEGVCNESDLPTTHRLPSPRGDCKYKICIYESKMPRDLQKAMKISMDWAELTHTYIRTGRTLDRQISRR